MMKRQQHIVIAIVSILALASVTYVVSYSSKDRMREDLRQAFNSTDVLATPYTSLASKYVDEESREMMFGLASSADEDLSVRVAAIEVLGTPDRADTAHTLCELANVLQEKISIPSNGEALRAVMGAMVDMQPCDLSSEVLFRLLEDSAVGVGQRRLALELLERCDGALDRERLEQLDIETLPHPLNLQVEKTLSELRDNGVSSLPGVADN